MKLNYLKLSFQFTYKPLLFGGKAMEYYGLRRAGADLDFIASKVDFAKLVKQYPQNLKDLWGDFGVAVNDIEVWKTVHYYDYDFYSQGSIEENNYLVISLEKLAFQKALAMQESKYLHDLELVIKKIKDEQYKRFDEVKMENNSIVSGLDKLKFIEKTGPEL